MKLRLHIFVLLLSVLLLFPFTNVRAQTTTSGGLAGIVTDPSGAVVPDARVEIRDEARGASQATKTDREGMYQFFFLTPGRYTLTVMYDGFRKQSAALNILLGPPVTVNVALEIARESATVKVTGEAPLIQAENGDVSTTMNHKQIAEIPNPGNDLTYIVQTAPGVVMNTDIQSSANFSILGMPGNSYLYTIDGMNDNDNGANVNLVGALVMLLGQNQIQEATVVSTGYSGQFGGSAGGNINYITKSGSNEFHGNAQYYWNGRTFNANDWFNNEFGNPRPFDIANQWAASLGGPVQRDKLFFFFDSEGLRLLIPQISIVSIPSPQFETATITNIDSRFGQTSASDAFYKSIFALYNAAPGASSAIAGGVSPTDPSGCTGFTGLGADPRTNMPVPCAMHFVSNRGSPSQDSLTAGRVDWIASKNDRAFLRLQYDGGRSASYVDPISPVFDADNSGPWWQGQFIETHTFGSSAASQFLVAGSYFALILRAKNPSEALSAFPTVLNFAPGTFNSLGGEDSIAALGFGRRNTQYQLSEDVVKAWGKQKFEFGGDFVRILWSELANSLGLIHGSSTIGVLTSQTLQAFYQGGVDPGVLTDTDPLPDFTQLTQSFTSQTTFPISFFNLGLYGQDEWHARPNLSLSLGLRAELYSNPACQSRCFARLAGPYESVSHDPAQPYDQAIVVNQMRAFEGIDNILWSPRFSFAWQPRGPSRNSVLRGGVGIFYDPLQGLILDSFSGNSPLYNVYTPFANNLAPNEQKSLFRDAADSNAAFVNGFAASQTLSQIQGIDPNFSPPFITAAPKRMHSPQFQRWSLEWQQGFGAGTSVSLGYFGHHGIHEMVQNPSVNAFGFGSLPTEQCASPPPIPPCYDPRFSGVTQINANGVSNYNGMVVSLKHQFTRWTQGEFQANYTYGHAFDEVSNGGLFSFTFGSSLNPQDPNNLRGSYGAAEYDVRHSFNANYVLELPVKLALRGRGSDYLVKGWQVSGTIFARSGFPYTVFDFLESGNLRRNNYFGLLYAVPAGPLGSAASCGEGAAFPLAPHPCQPPQLSADGTAPNPSALFVQSGCETGFNTGNLPGPLGTCGGSPVSLSQGRNRFRGPGYFNTDFAIMKNTKIPRLENVTLGIGFQFFNFFNHPNFGFPNGDMSSPTLGEIFGLEQSPTSILGAGIGGDAAPRMIQLKVQLQF